MPNRLLHASGVAAEGLFPNVPEIRLLKQSFYHLDALGFVGDPFEDGEVVEHVEG